MEYSKAIEKVATESAKKQKRLLSAKRNQLALWLGRLTIAFNELEYAVALTLSYEVSTSLGQRPPPSSEGLGSGYLFAAKIKETGLTDMLMASMSFGQKLDFLSALLFNRFSNDEIQQKYIQLVIKAMSKAEDFRNRMAHSVWLAPIIFGTDYSRHKVQTNGRKGLKIHRESANIALIKQAVEDIYILLTFGLGLGRSNNLITTIGTKPFEEIAKRFEQSEIGSQKQNDLSRSKTGSNPLIKG